MIEVWLALALVLLFIYDYAGSKQKDNDDIYEPFFTKEEDGWKIKGFRRVRRGNA